MDINTGERLGFNEAGELQIKSPYLMSGYHNDNSAFVEGGWLKTGDIVSIDEDFCFTVLDRLSEIINCNGWYVSPTTIEAILKTHPAVQEAVVFGERQEEGGERPVAFVSFKQGYETDTINEIDAFINERVDEKNRVTVRFVDAMPVTHTGKVNRRFFKDFLLG